eukprot:TRINITY_DN6585_c0_g2_i1.p1 TRINITY_DN6585_c0_g2~~TRINITY_DN6585_c0_g2_i1.p1  ORF type:complete len:2103 (-),score=378.73 TRINITY_DN6585_c0_g2_i1:26-5695(-)
MSDLCRFRLTVKPAKRLEALQEATRVTDDPACGGFVRHYRTICNYHGTLVNQTIVDDVEHIFSKNNIKEFILGDFLSNTEKYPNPDFEALMAVLAHNTWFTSLNCDNTPLGNEGMKHIENAIRTNKTLRTLSLKNTGGKGTALAQLFVAMKENPELRIENLEISGNSLDVKSGVELGVCISSCFSLLQTLNISNTQTPKKSMITLFETMNATPSLHSSLQNLFLSQNKLDDESSKLLGVFIRKSTAISTLKMSSSSPNINSLILGMIDEDSNIKEILKNLALTCLDFSNNKVTKYSQDDAVAFINSFPNLVELNLNGTDVSAHVVRAVFKESIKVLDISRNYFPDDHIIFLMEHLLSLTKDRVLALTHLYMNKVWGRRTKKRKDATFAVANLINATNIQTFHMRGKGKSALKISLVDLILTFVNNRVLKDLNVFGHQSGDKFANAILTLLQHNASLHTLNLDNNGVSLKGLKLYKLALERNGSIKHMPLPVLDIAHLLKANEENKDLIMSIHEISWRMQTIVAENAQMIAVIGDDLDEEFELRNQKRGSSARGLTARAANKYGTTRMTNKKASTLKLNTEAPVNSTRSSPLLSSMPGSRRRASSVLQSYSEPGSPVAPSGPPKTLSMNFFINLEMPVPESGDESMDGDVALEGSVPSPLSARRKNKLRKSSRRHGSPPRSPRYGSSESSVQERTKRKTKTTGNFQHPLHASLLSMYDSSVSETSETSESISEMSYTSKKSTRKWNEEFQQFLEQEDTVVKWSSLAYLVKEFEEAAEDGVKTIVSEQNSEIKVVPQVGFQTYQLFGITFQLVLDFQINNTSWMFGGPSKNYEKSGKQARHHLRALQALYDVSQEYNCLLCFPLTSVIEYKGYHVICSALPACSKASMISGMEFLQSPPAASPREFFKKIEEQFKLVNAKLNLAPSTCMDRVIYSSAELEAYIGSDFRYYVTNGFWHVMPSEYPLPYISFGETITPKPQAVLYNLLRPSFVSKYESPLSPNALMAWTKNDPNKEALDTAVKNATEHLLNTVIPKFAQFLDTQDPTTSQLVSLVHQHGINIRHLGRVRSAVKSQVWKDIILEECITRTIKNIVRGFLRHNTPPNNSSNKILDFIHLLLQRNSEVPYCVTAESPDQHDRSEFVDLRNSTVSASSPCLVYANTHVPAFFGSFYFEVTVEQASSEVIVGCTDAKLLNFTDADRFLVSHVVLPTDCKTTIGVYLNLEVNIVYFIVNGTMKLATIKRNSEEETPEFIPAFEIKDSAKVKFNFGFHSFKYNMIDISKQVSCPSPQQATNVIVSKLFWSFPSSFSQAPLSHPKLNVFNAKPLKQELLTRFVGVLKEKEHMMMHDLRSSVNVLKIVQRVSKSIGLLLSSRVRTILSSEKSVALSLSAEDLEGWTCRKDTLDLSLAPNFARLSTDLLQATAQAAHPPERKQAKDFYAQKGEEIANQMPERIKTRGFDITPLEYYLWANFSRNLSDFEPNVTKRKGHLRLAFEKCQEAIQLIENSEDWESKGQLLWQCRLMESQLSLLLEKPVLSVKRSLCTLQVSNKISEEELATMKNSIFNSKNKAEAKRIVEFAQHFCTTYPGSTRAKCLYFIAKCCFCAYVHQNKQKWKWQLSDDTMSLTFMEELYRNNSTGTIKILLYCLIEKDYTRGLIYMALLSIANIIVPFSIDLASRVGNSHTRVILDNPHLTILSLIKKSGTPKEDNRRSTRKPKDANRKIALSFPKISFDSEESLSESSHSITIVSATGSLSSSGAATPSTAVGNSSLLTSVASVSSSSVASVSPRSSLSSINSVSSPMTKSAGSVSSQISMGSLNHVASVSPRNSLNSVNSTTSSPVMSPRSSMSSMNVSSVTSISPSNSMGSITSMGSVAATGAESESMGSTNNADSEF